MDNCWSCRSLQTEKIVAENRAEEFRNEINKLNNKLSNALVPKCMKCSCEPVKIFFIENDEGEAFINFSCDLHENELKNSLLSDIHVTMIKVRKYNKKKLTFTPR